MYSTEAVKTIVGDLALVFTIVNYASGVQICRKVREKGSTHDLSPLPFLAGMLATFLWFEYGFMKGDSILVWVNSIGFLLQMSFLCYFYSYTKVKGTLNWKIFVLLLVLAAVYYEVTYFITEKDVALSIVGMMGCIAAFLFFASPLSSLLHVVRTQSVETLPFPLILSAFVVSSLWTLYGFICEDAFIYVDDCAPSCRPQKASAKAVPGKHVTSPTGSDAGTNTRRSGSRRAPLSTGPACRHTATSPHFFAGFAKVRAQLRGVHSARERPS